MSRGVAHLPTRLALPTVLMKCSTSHSIFLNAYEAKCLVEPHNKAVLLADPFGRTCAAELFRVNTSQ
jgi:hypothetical protein